MDPEKQTIRYLYKASKLVPYAVLQCHYLSNCRTRGRTDDMISPENHFPTSVICKFCSNIFDPGRCQVTLMPKKKPGKKMRKIIRKSERAPQLLNKFEKKLLEKRDVDKDNKLVIKCLFCKKKTYFPLTKPIQSSQVEEIPKKQMVIKKKKKKKKKDIYAGLKSSAFSSSTAKNASETSVGKFKTDFKKEMPTTKQDSNESSNPKTSDIKRPTVKKVKKISYVKQQVKEAKVKISEDKTKKLLENKAKGKKLKKLQRILKKSAAPPKKSSSLRDFIKSLN